MMVVGLIITFAFINRSMMLGFWVVHVVAFWDTRSAGLNSGSIFAFYIWIKILNYGTTTANSFLFWRILSDLISMSFVCVHRMTWWMLLIRAKTALWYSFLTTSSCTLYSSDLPPSQGILERDGDNREDTSHQSYRKQPLYCSLVSWCSTRAHTLTSYPLALILL